MEARNCVSPHHGDRKRAAKPKRLVIIRKTFATKPCPMRLLSDSAALLERFARTIFRTKIDAATRNN